MKKFLILSLTAVLIFGVSLIATAEGFNLGFGYNQLNSDYTVSYNNQDLAEINLPCKMFTVDLGYEFTDWFAVNLNHRWGTTDLASVLDDLVVIDLENTISRAEAAFKWSLGDNATIAALVGYTSYESSGNLDYDSGTYHGDLTAKLSGFYLGPQLTYTPTDRVELGIAYRYLFDPDGDIKLKYMGNVIAKGDLVDVDYATLDLYAKVGLDDNWEMKAGYEWTGLEYSIEGLEEVDVSRKISGLYLLVNYNF